MNKWKYKVLMWDAVIDTSETHSLEDTLNEYGELGWELVNIIPQVVSESNSEFQVEEVKTKFNSIILKKQIED